MRTRISRLAAIAWAASAVPLTAGCASRVDMATAYDARRPATTIPYSGVKETTRQYPDYGAIRADILAPSAARKPR